MAQRKKSVKSAVAQSRLGSVILFNRVLIRRNVEGFPFPGDDEDVEDAVLDFIRESLSSRDVDIGVKVFDLSDESDLESLSRITESHTINELVLHGNDLKVALDDDAHRRGVSNSAMIFNGRDHITFFSRRSGDSIFETYKEVYAIERKIDKAVPFAFDKKLGYLSRSPLTIGTGLCGDYELYLPGLLFDGYLEKVLDGVTDMGFIVNVIRAPDGEIADCLVSISSAGTLGLSDEQVLRNLETTVQEVVRCELQSRASIARHGSFIYNDHFSRLVATIDSAKLMTIHEMFSLFLGARFGMEMGYIKRFKKDFEVVLKQLVSVPRMTKYLSSNLKEKEIASKIDGFKEMNDVVSCIKRAATFAAIFDKICG